MPYDFAEKLFDKTRIGMRVIISPNDAAPVEFSHPALFVPNAKAVAAAPARAETLAREAAGAAKMADEAKKAAATAAREAASLAASSGLSAVGFFCIRQPQKKTKQREERLGRVSSHWIEFWCAGRGGFLWRNRVLQRGLICHLPDDCFTAGGAAVGFLISRSA